MRKFLIPISLLGISLVLAGCSHVAKQVSQQPQSHGKVTAEVDVTSQGFSPDKVKIKVGEAVKFNNKSGRAIFVASNPHPVHTNYSQFQSGNVVDGQSYTFTFEREGSWGYHDHLSPGLTGEVEVGP